MLLALSLAGLSMAGQTPASPHSSPDRIRILIETDAGGDPDDEQSLVRFLLYSNEWDVEGILANRSQARDRENLNPERTGIGIIRRLVSAYGECQRNLALHDPRYPTATQLHRVTLDATDASDAGVQRIIEAVDSQDPRPLWYSDWGSDRGSSTNNLRRALDRILRERGPDGYARFKGRLRLSSSDAFGPHTFELPPSFPLWVDTWRPEIDRRRWYHQFSRIVGPAGGFDPWRDLLRNHGPLGAMYPTNTSPAWKEGDSLSFIHCIPVGLGAPDDPTRGGWGGRHALRNNAGGRPYFWASAVDGWNGTTNRDQTLQRWATAIQNDFRARLDWCVQPVASANHPPEVRLSGGSQRTVRPGQRIELSVAGSTDPDGQPLRFEWQHYREPGTGNLTLVFDRPTQSSTSVRIPDNAPDGSYHLIASVADSGAPPLTRYARVIVHVDASLPILQAPLPSGPGLAARYPGDLGIGSDSRVLLFEDFEVPNKAALGKRWEQMSDKDGEVLALVADHPPGSRGTNTLEVTARLGRNTGGDLYRRLSRPLDRAFARFLVRFDEANGYTHHFVHFGGYHPSTPWAQGGAGVRPAGDERFTVGVEPFGENGRFQPPGAWFLYTYWQEMKASADGKYWGNGLRPARPFPVPKSRWQCLEVMIQLNSRPDASDGELAFWVDGHLAAHFAPGTRRGPWTGIGFTQAAEGGEPFEGFRWRKSTDLRINFFWLLDYVTDSAARQNHVASPPEFNRVRFDHVVVAEDYIGPILPAP
jgi:hypothetical protein